MPTNPWIHLSLLLATSLLFAAAFALGFFHMRRAALAGVSGKPASAKGNARGAALPHESSIGSFARTAMIAGTVMGVGLLAWRAAALRTLTLAISNPFDVFLALGMLLALLVIYFRWTRHLRSLSFFLLPMISLLLLLGFVLAAVHPGENSDYHNLWHILHITSIVAATALFALGCVGGVVYLLADRQLRRKGLDTSHRWIGLPPLASIEKLMQWMIYIGFPLLTVATVAGVLLVSKATAPQTPAGPRASLTVQITFGILSWVVYAVLLQVPLNPRFRGRRAAWLSITGFVLFIGAFAAASWS